MKTIKARWFTRTEGRDIGWVVLHSMETPPTKTAAENVGRFFANLPATKKASAHVGVDTDSVVRYVDDKDVAYAAPGMNKAGLQLEIAGHARYSLSEWQGTGRMIDLAADVVRDWCDRYDIPKRFVDAPALRRGDRGITTHKQVSDAFGMSDHWDPGLGFDVEAFVKLVNGTVSDSAVVVESEEDDMAVSGRIYEWEDGAVATVNRKGEVFCHELPNRPTAKYWGGITELRDDAKKAFAGDPFIVGISKTNSQAGYIVLDGAAKFQFDESARKFFK